MPTATETETQEQNERSQQSNPTCQDAESELSRGIGASRAERRNVSHERTATRGAAPAPQEACRGSAVRSMAWFGSSFFWKVLFCCKHWRWPWPDWRSRTSQPWITGRIRRGLWDIDCPPNGNGVEPFQYRPNHCQTQCNQASLHEPRTTIRLGGPFCDREHHDCDR